MSEDFLVSKTRTLAIKSTAYAHYKRFPIYYLMFFRVTAELISRFEKSIMSNEPINSNLRGLMFTVALIHGKDINRNFKILKSRHK